MGSDVSELLKLYVAFLQGAYETFILLPTAS